MDLVLGSASPRRRALLAQIGVVPSDIRPADIDETPLAGEQPRPYAIRLAAQKAAAVDAHATELVLAADTVVAVGRRILGKPKDATEAIKFLNLLSGRRHRVITAVCLQKGDEIWARDVTTTVKMKRLSITEREEYIASNEWNGKAGGYAIQGIGSALIPWISGSYTAVVGLPLPETAALLTAAGYPVSLTGDTI